MDIVITDVRVTASQQMVFELFRAGIKEIQSPVFGSNPNVAIGIFAELADYISRKRIFRTIGIIPLDILMLGRQVTHSTEISPDPDSPFPILITGIDTFFILFVVGEGTKDEKMVLKEGDNVLYGKYAGTEVEDGDTKYLIMRQSDVLGIIE